MTKQPGELFPAVTEEFCKAHISPFRFCFAKFKNDSPKIKKYIFLDLENFACYNVFDPSFQINIERNSNDEKKSEQNFSHYYGGNNVAVSVCL